MDPPGGVDALGAGRKTGAVAETEARLQRAWMSQGVVAVMLGALACGEQPTQVPEGAPSTMAEGVGAPSAETLSALRTQARHAPVEALERLAHLEAEGDTAEEIARIRALADTTHFNNALKQVAATTDHREAIATILELAHRPTPVNKRRLAEPVWGLIGKLEAQTDAQPAFVKAAAERLLADSALTDLLGPKVAERLRALREAALVRRTTERVAMLLAKGPFEEVVAQLVAWHSGPKATGEVSLRAAMRRVVEA
ncbi:MAG: hypothetical protein QF464_11400, partial [Myxococcota bacterium]|nr:hypothetical protein [Myxococcota bacterium]